MKEFKGTPGAWVAHDDEESMATSVIMSDFGDILCVVGTYMTSVEEDFANADLIAAAPELLEALQRCESVLSNIPLEVSDVEDLLYARAAINKALGEQQ